MNHLGQLSIELVSLIVQEVAHRDLYACTLINHAFHAIATPLLWRTLHDKNIGTFIKLIHQLDHPPPLSSSSSSLARHSVGQYIRHGNFNDLDNATFLLIIHHVPFLETLAIDSARFITDNSLQQLPSHCPHLISLHLRRTPITRRSLVALAHYCPQLTQLDLDKCNNLKIDIFSALPTMPRLNQLCIEGSVFKDILTLALEEEGNNDNHSTTKARHVLALHQLTRLTLTGMPAHFTKHLLLFGNASVWPHLTHVALGSAYTVTDPEVITFIKSHPGLISLEVHMTTLSDTTLEAMAIYLPHLERVGLVNWLHMTPAGVRRLICQCRSLTCVYFGGRCWSDTLSEAFPEATGYCFIDLRRRRKLFQLDQESINRIRLRG